MTNEYGPEFSLQVWNQFPEEGNSAAYMLGTPEEFTDDTPRGVIIVFNARRKTVRAYPRTQRNEERIASLQWGDFGYLDKITNWAYADSKPRGVVIPHYDALLYCIDGVAICNAGEWGYISDRGSRDRNRTNQWVSVELEWFNQVYDRLRISNLSIDVWGNFMKFFPALNTQPYESHFEQIPYATMTVADGTAQEITVSPQPMRQEEFSGFALNWPGAVKFSPTPRQASELQTQLEYWQSAFDSAWRKGDYDTAEYASLFCMALLGIVASFA